MSLRRSKRPRHEVMLAVGALLLLSTSGTALTAGMTGSAGSVDHKIQPYPTFSASVPAYSDPGSGTIVTFTVTPAAGQVRARVITVTTPSPSWETCSSGDGTTWTCPVPGLTVEEATAGTFEWVAVP